MPTIQKRQSLAAIDNMINTGLNNKEANMENQVSKKAKVLASAQPSGFEEDLEIMTRELNSGPGMVFFWLYYAYIWFGYSCFSLF